MAVSPVVDLSTDSIVVEDRYRKDLGDLSGLMESITRVGLLHPIIVTPESRLVVGERRLRAFERLGHSTIPARVLDLEEMLRAERDENFCRKDLAPSEAVAITDALEPMEREAARQRMLAGQPSVNFSEGPAPQALDRVAAAVGMSRPTLVKAREVVQAAEAEPEKYGPLLEQMDRTGKVDAAYRQLKRAQDERQILAVQPVRGKYRTIMVDPPWDYEGLSLAGRGMPEYAVMSHEELLALPVPEWADAECHLYLWTTNNFIPRAIELVIAWGFAYKTLITWVKPRIGLGSYFRNSTEHCLFGVKGDLTTRVKDISTHFEAPTGAHSEKPEAIYRICERASYPQYLEAFARKTRDGWDVWGAEVAAAQSLHTG